MRKTAEQKAEAVKLYRELKVNQSLFLGGYMSNWEISLHLGVPYTTLWRWSEEQRHYEDAGLERPAKHKPGPKPKTSNPNPKTTQED